MVNYKKEMIIYFIGTVMLAVLNFIISILYGSMFSTNDFGIYSLIFSLYSLISQFLNGWLSQSLIRFYSIENDKSIVSSTYLMHFIFSIFILVSTNIVIYFLNIQLIEKIMLSIFTVIYFFETYLLITNTILRIKNLSKQYSINVILNGLIKIFSLLFLYYVIHIKSVIVISISLLISEIIQCLYLTYKQKIYKYFKKDNFDSKLLLSMFKFGYPLIGVSVTSWVLNVSDRFIIKFYNSNSIVGIYSYSYSLANSIVFLIIQFIMLGAYPNIVKMWKNKGKSDTEKLIKKYLDLYLLTILPICFGILALGEDFFRLAISKDYIEGYLVFIITAFGIFLLGISQYTNKPWEIAKKTKSILLFNLISAIINIILNILLIPKYGYAVAAVTTALSYFIYIFMSMVLNKNELRVHIFDIEKLKIFISSFSMFIFIIFIKMIFEISNWYIFASTIILSMMVYLIMIILLKIFAIKDVKSLLKK